MTTRLSAFDQSFQLSAHPKLLRLDRSRDLHFKLARSSGEDDKQQPATFVVDERGIEKPVPKLSDDSRRLLQQLRPGSAFRFERTSVHSYGKGPFYNYSTMHS